MTIFSMYYRLNFYIQNVKENGVTVNLFFYLAEKNVTIFSWINAIHKIVVIIWLLLEAVVYSKQAFIQKCQLWYCSIGISPYHTFSIERQRQCIDLAFISDMACTKKKKKKISDMVFIWGLLKHNSMTQFQTWCLVKEIW